MKRIWQLKQGYDTALQIKRVVCYYKISTVIKVFALPLFRKLSAWGGGDGIDVNLLRRDEKWIVCSAVDHNLSQC